MTSFNDKEKAAENKYAHDKETEFKIHARTGKMLGLWAAGKLGINGAQAEAYASSLSIADLGKNDNDLIVRKIHDDFQAKGVAISDHDIRAQMHQVQKEVRKQIVGD